MLCCAASPSGRCASWSLLRVRLVAVHHRGVEGDRATVASPDPTAGCGRGRVLAGRGGGLWPVQDTETSQVELASLFFCS